MAKKERTYFRLPVRKSGNSFTKGTLALNEMIREFKEDKVNESKIKASQKTRKGFILKARNLGMDKFIAKNGRTPDGPVSFEQHLPDSVQEVEYIISDKSGQVPLKENQIDRLSEQIGEDNIDKVTRTMTTYKLNNSVLRQEAKNGKQVEEVVFKLLESAIKNCKDLEEHQKLSVLEVNENTHLMADFHNQMIPVLGDKTAGEVSAILGEVKEQVVRYLK
jgi:hypothetical protein